MNWRPLKHFCVGAGEYGLNISSESYVDDGVRLIRTTDIDEHGTLKENDRGVHISPGRVDGLLLKEQDILFSRSGTLGRLYVHGACAEAMTFAGYLVRFRPRRDVDHRYIAYCAQASFFMDQILSDAVVSTIANFNAERYGELRLPWQSFAMQRRIADFLDVETARIDALIAKKQNMLMLLSERVAGTLDQVMSSYGFTFPPDVNGLGSNISVPTGWRVVRLGQVLRRLTNGYVGPTRDILVDSGVRYIQSLHIKDGVIDFDRRPFYVTQEWHESHPRINLQPGDVLIVQTGDIGKVAFVPDGFGPASCHALQIARVREDFLSGVYLAEYLRTSFGYQSLISRATGALHPHLEGSIRDVPVVLPPVSVQMDMVEQIRDARRHELAVRIRLENQIRLLKEHRQALITAAVTGEMEVPGVS